MRDRGLELALGLPDIALQVIDPVFYQQVRGRVILTVRVRIRVRDSIG
jgi:hypothetical protein